MLRYLVLVVLCLSLCPVPSVAQNSVHLCVANTQFMGAPASTALPRDLLLKFLDKEKPGKSVSIEDVPLDASEPAEAAASAKGKNCDYLLTTNQVESHSSNTFLAGMGTMSTTSTPMYYVTMAYKLTNVSDGAEISAGNFKASDAGSEQNAIGFTMHKIAGMVTGTIRSSRN